MSCPQWQLVDLLKPLQGSLVCIKSQETGKVIETGLLGDISCGGMCLIGSHIIWEMELDNNQVNMVVIGSDIYIKHPELQTLLDEPHVPEDEWYEA